MSDQVKPEDIVLVHHRDIGAIAGHRGNLAALLQRGRQNGPESILDDGAPAPIAIALLHLNERGQGHIEPGTMTWLSPGGVTHISPADKEIAAAVISAMERYRLAAAGIVAPGQGVDPRLLEQLR